MLMPVIKFFKPFAKTIFSVPLKIAYFGCALNCVLISKEELWNETHKSRNKCKNRWKCFDSHWVFFNPAFFSPFVHNSNWDAVTNRVRCHSVFLLNVLLLCAVSLRTRRGRYKYAYVVWVRQCGRETNTYCLIKWQIIIQIIIPQLREKILSDRFRGIFKCQARQFPHLFDCFIEDNMGPKGFGNLG